MPGGKRNRQRGFELERECVNAARAVGLDAKRAWGSNGEALGLCKEVDVVIDGRPYQMKRKKKLPAWLALKPGTVGTIFREDRARAYALIPFEDLLDLLGKSKQCDELFAEHMKKAVGE